MGTVCLYKKTPYHQSTITICLVPSRGILVFMYKQEEINPYNDSEGKGSQVERMFDNIAHTYDRLNHLMSCNIDKLWRRKAMSQLAPFAPQTLLDVATGTGDLAILAAKKLKPKSIVGADISEEMMEIGRQKVKQQGLDGIISFRKEDCMALSFADNSFDVVMAAFGIRNFPDLDKGLKEMFRVLKPGGKLCIIELTTPVAFPFKQAFSVYSHTVLPAYGRLISKDTSAYTYLTATIEAFPQGERMMQILQSAGFRDTKFQRLTFGVCTLYLATK
jgi:demethylmenaquinone methyltransferase / 2-methoxy-6-polyprenyl-1,4-benzoquinol methylase